MQDHGRRWRPDTIEANVTTAQTLIWHDPDTRLEVRCDVTRYSDFAATEWVLHLKNDGQQDSPILSEILAADVRLFEKAAGPVELIYANGSTAAITDFRPLSAKLPEDGQLVLEPQRGRGSDGRMPYFQALVPNELGAVVAVGWSGQWRVRFLREPDGALRLQAGMATTHLRLHPGETIRTPAIIVLFHGSDPVEGRNQWRRFMLAHCTPQVGGRSPTLPIAASAAAIPMNQFAENNQKQAIANVAKKKLPVDTWWIDAGWMDKGFPDGIGNIQPDPIRFPRGLKPVADAVHQAGLKFLLWFEPERAMPGTWLRQNHSDWLLVPRDLPPPYLDRAEWRIMDMGDADALAWTKRHYSDMVRDLHIDIYRNDFNTPPLYHWHDEPDRVGIREIRYVAGVYDYFDTLRRENPWLLIDNCTAGGRRLDFEMLRRSVVLWRSDYCWDPIGSQAMQYGLSFWLPLHGMGAISTDAYHFRSGWASGQTYALNFYSANDPCWVPLRKRIEEYRPIRDLFIKDFYPLTPYSVQDSEWIAWQYHDPATGRGLLQAFRRAHAGPSSIRVKLHGLESRGRFRLMNLDAPQKPALRSGVDLMTEGEVLSASTKPAAIVVVYERVDR
jgi:alpha-galactosidase